MAARSLPPSTPASSLSTTLHLFSVGVLSNAFRLLFRPGPMQEWMTKASGGYWVYLTNLGLAGSLAYCSVALLKDLIPTLKVFDALKTGLGVIVIPLSGVISLLYWSIMLYDKDLMVPPGTDMEVFLPKSLDLSIHAFPAILLWTDFLFFSPPFSKRVWPTSITCIVTIIYALWVERNAAINGYFPYPFLTISNFSTRLVIYIGAALLNLGLYHLANRIHFGVDRILGKSVVKSKRQAQGKMK